MLQRRPAPSLKPEAELWMGAHPSSPSLLLDHGAPGDDPVPLTEAIARDPATLLGPGLAAAYGSALPYLLKVLAAEHPLSLQAHPDADQARTGFLAEEAAGVPRDSAERNYVDANHKPELLVALDDFDALCGFRDPDETASVLEAFRVDALKPVIAILQQGPVSQRLRLAVETLMAWPAAERTGLVAAVAEGGRALLGRLNGAYARSGALAADLGRRYPDDVGVVVALLLNHVRLLPDEGMFVPAGVLHAHLGGAGVEVMAASDNVLRGGLTNKRVDVPALLRVLRYEVLAHPIVPPDRPGPGLFTWPSPVSEFALAKAVVRPGTGVVTLPGAGPRIVACVRGEAHLRTGEQVGTIRSGESVFVSASQPEIVVSGDAAVFQASPHQALLSACAATARSATNPA